MLVMLSVLGELAMLAMLRVLRVLMRGPAPPCLTQPLLPAPQEALVPGAHLVRRGNGCAELDAHPHKGQRLLCVLCALQASLTCCHMDFAHPILSCAALTEHVQSLHAARPTPALNALRCLLPHLPCLQLRAAPGACGGDAVPRGRHPGDAGEWRHACFPATCCCWLGWPSSACVPRERCSA